MFQHGYFPPASAYNTGDFFSDLHYENLAGKLSVENLCGKFWKPPKTGPL